mgnify:CR=1 FL=1
MIRIFNGIRPAVVALILFPCISAVRALHLKYVQLIAPVIATVLIWQFGLSPIYVVLAGISGGLVYTLWLKNKIKDDIIIMEVEYEKESINECGINDYFSYINWLWK